MTKLATNFTATPYWWEVGPPGEATHAEPERSYDVLVIGSGVTGLSVALTLAEAGRSVLICEARTIGSGASTRNNGAIVPFFFLKQHELEAKFGSRQGAAIARLAVAAFDHLRALPGKYDFDAQIKSYDRYFLARSESHQKSFALAAEKQRLSGMNLNWHPIGNNELIDRTGLKGFHGGVYVPDQLCMHPGLFTRGLARACVKAGVHLLEHSGVESLERTAGHWTVRTQKGVVKATHVVAATNGYTGPELPALHKRLMSVRLHMAATEPLPDDMLHKIFPTDRQFADSKSNMSWIRPSPDGRCALIGGRAGMMGDDPEQHARTLHGDMVDLIPDMAPLKITHAWYGSIAFPYDLVPHMGQFDGLHYVTGCCGIGMTTGTFLGTRLAQRILGVSHDESDMPLDQLSFPKEPLPGIGPLYLRAGIAWINAKDRFQVQRRQSSEV